MKLNAVTKTADGTWPLPGCDSPTGMAIDPEHARLFSVCDANKMAITNTSTGSQLALLSIGSGPDAAGYDAKNQLAFSSNGESGDLTVIDASHGYRALQTLPTKTGARTMTYDAITDRLYLATADYGTPVAGSKRAPILPDTFTVLVVGR